MKTTTATRGLGKYAIHWANLRHLFKHRQRNYNIPGKQLDDMGLSESKNQQEPKQENELEKLQEAAKESHDILYRAKAIFPFDLFPDIITLDRHKLTIVNRSFFKVETTTSVELGNIMNVQADMGPLFGTLLITSEHFVNNTQTVQYLRRDDVLKMQQLLQGALIANKENIDINKIGTADLIKLLNDLGKGEFNKPIDPKRAKAAARDVDRGAS
jgi:hypothetical protein